MDKADDYGSTPLIYAAERGLIEVLKALLTAGADIDKADDYGCTPLIYAAKKCHIEVLKALLAAGADKESVNQAGNTSSAWPPKRVTLRSWSCWSPCIRSIPPCLGSMNGPTCPVHCK